MKIIPGKQMLLNIQWLHTLGCPTPSPILYQSIPTKIIKQLNNISKINKIHKKKRANIPPRKWDISMLYINDKNRNGHYCHVYKTEITVIK